MDYSEFLTEIEDRIRERINTPDIEVFLCQDDIWYFLCIRKTGTEDVYLDMEELYEKFTEGQGLTSIVQEICNTYEGEVQIQEQTADFHNFNLIKDRIIIVPESKKTSMKQIKDITYINYNDMMITFQYLFPTDILSFQTCSIPEEAFGKWGISIKQLYEIALQNTMRLLPSEAEEVEIGDILGEQYMLTNTLGIHGAACMFYEDDIIKQLADEEQSDIYILPINVHGVVLVLSNDETSVKTLKRILRLYNKRNNNDNTFLSNGIYHYDHLTGKIRIF